MDSAAVRAALDRDRAATLSQLEQLRRDVRNIIAAAADVATDDEHDPEGATIAYERSRTQALIEQAELHLSEIDAASARLVDGRYGICVRCGRSIGSERLQARPFVSTCIDCAATGLGRHSS
jgi:RNA polymerase-binding transcription factor DksA